MPPLAFVVVGAAWQVTPLWLIACCGVQMQKMIDTWAEPLAKRNDDGVVKT